MPFILTMALVGGALRLAAPHIRKLVVAKELRKPGMQFLQAGQEVVPIDGVWSQDELPAVLTTLQGLGDRKILETGRERADLLREAGCPACPRCKKLFPQGVPTVCDRCGGSCGTT